VKGQHVQTQIFRENTKERFIHGKNDFAEVSKNFAEYSLNINKKIILLDY